MFTPTPGDPRVFIGPMGFAVERRLSTCTQVTTNYTHIYPIPFPTIPKFPLIFSGRVSCSGSTLYGRLSFRHCQPRAAETKSSQFSLKHRPCPISSMIRFVETKTWVDYSYTLGTAGLLSKRPRVETGRTYSHTHHTHNTIICLPLRYLFEYLPR